jgi:hypothetical protein
MEEIRNILLSYIYRQNHYNSCLILTGIHSVNLRHFTAQPLVPNLGSLPASAGTETYASTWLHSNIYCAFSSWCLPRSKVVRAKLVHSMWSVTMQVTLLTSNIFTVEIEVEITLWLTVSKSVYLGIVYPCGTCDQILLPVGMLLSEICSLVSIGRPLWREDGSAICSVITQLSESLRTHNHTLLSHLRLPQPRGPGSHIYIPQEQGGPVIPPGTLGSLRTRLLRLTRISTSICVCVCVCVCARARARACACTNISTNKSPDYYWRYKNEHELLTLHVRRNTLMRKPT